jgi:hypothetical protein
LRGAIPPALFFFHGVVLFTGIALDNTEGGVREWNLVQEIKILFMGLKARF